MANPVIDDVTKRMHYHLEHVIPGAILAAVVYQVYPAFGLVLGKSTVEHTIVFLCTAYLLGAVTFVGTRMLLDRFAWNFVHPTIFYIFVKREFARGGKPCTWWRDFACNAYAIRKQYHRVRSEAEANKNPFRRQQVDERRQRIRLIRSTIFPMSLWVGAAISIPLGVIAGIVMLIMFSYGEVTIFEEAIADRNDLPIDISTTPA